MFKPKKPAQPVADWIDHDAIKAVQEQATRTQAINEPLERLVALHACVNTLDALTRGDNPYALTDEGQDALRRQHARAERLAGWVPSFATIVFMGGMLGSLIVASAFPPFGLAIAFGGIGLSACGLMGGVVLFSKNYHRQRAVPVPLREAAESLKALKEKMEEAIAEIEANVALEDVQYSDHLATALKVSPSLKARFGEEALRRNLEAAAPRELVKKPQPPNRK